MKHFKFIHFLWHPSPIFCPRLVKMVNNPECGFSIEDHLFVTPYKELYNELKSYSNVVLYETKNPFSAKMVNVYAPYGDWLFLHSIPDWRKAIFIRKRFQKKIIWRTWGHDAIFFNVNKGNVIKRIIKFLLNIIKIRVVKSFYAVAVSTNYVDVLDIREKFGNVKTAVVSYPDINERKQVMRPPNNNGDVLNILVGHSGVPFNNHIEILKSLKKFERYNIRIFLLLSYGGDAAYIKEVVDYVKENWPQKIEIISDFMSMPKFIDFCSKIDVAIFDGKNSYAVGNVTILQSMRKKLFFNRNGLWHRAYEEKECPHCCTDELKNMSFDSLRTPLNYQKDVYEGLDKMNFDDLLDGWKKLLYSLEKKT